MIKLLLLLFVAHASLNTKQFLPLPISILQGGTAQTSYGTNGQCLQSNGTGLTTWGPCGGGGSSQWTTQGSDIYYTTGNVGVGTTSIGAPLEVDSSTISGALPIISVNVTGTGGGEVDGLTVNSDGNSGIRIKNSVAGTTGLYIGNVNGPTADYQILNQDSGGIKMTVNAVDVFQLKADLSASFVSDNFGLYSQSGSTTANLKLFDIPTTHYVGFKAPASLLTSTIWTLPGGDGVSGQALTTDGAGTLRFRNRGNGFMPLSTGSLTSIVANEIVGAGKTAHNILIENLEASAAGFTCLSNPTLTLLDCGTSPGPCTSGTTTIGSVTLTGSNTITDGTVSSGTLLIGHYWAWQVTSGSCTLLNAVGNAEFTPQ